MITILTGLPRSGKSYRAVWLINKNFIDFTSKDYSKYHYLYTNIGGFKHDEVNQKLAENPLVFDDEVLQKQSFQLIWSSFYPHIFKMFEMSLDEKSDEEILRYAKYHKLTPALIVVDEAYRFYTKKTEPPLVWLNGYHGHLGLDIVLIIHRPSLMHSDYKAHTEEFIDAQPKSRSLSDNIFRYKFYGDDAYLDKNFYARDSLKADPVIFDLYKSGDMYKPKKLIYKFIFIILGSILFISLAFFTLFYRLGHMGDSSDRNETNVTTSSNVTNSSLKPPTDISNFTPAQIVQRGNLYLRVRCDFAQCWRVDQDFFYYVPRLYFTESLKKFPNSSLISSSEFVYFGERYDDYLYSVSSDFMDYFSVWKPHQSNGGFMQGSDNKTFGGGV